MKINRIVFVGLFAIVGFAGAVIGHIMAGKATLASTMAASPAVRQFYLTKSLVKGDGALTVCAAGYHMASFWEIKDVPNLKYDATLGVTSPDSGSGPPTMTQEGSMSGWVRTGAISFGGTTGVGMANCMSWTSASESDDGTAISLVTSWMTTYGGPQVLPFASWWQVQLRAGNVTPPPCSVPHRVWCASN